jgi:hypothetical protein
MKRKLSLIIFACLAFAVQGIYAQDAIMKSDGEEILAKVLEVSTEQVKYKKFDNLDGPNYSISSLEVFMIKYEDGSKKVFEANTSTGKITIRHTAAETDKTHVNPTTSANPVTPVTQSVQVKQANNGVLEMLGFDGKSVTFRAMVETPFSTVSLNSGERSIKASSISNTKGNIVFSGGATARAGSSLMLPGGALGMKLQKDTEARCDFENVPAGFVPKSIVFVTDDNSVPMTYEFASGIWIKPKQMSASAEPYSAKSGEYDIVELIENNIVETEISGRDIAWVSMRIRRLVPYPVSVRIPAGSFFVSENPSAQNMVATEARKASLAAESWQTLQIPAACANRTKDIPDSRDKFSIRSSPGQRELARLIPALGKPGTTVAVKQAAVWIVTDNADYAELGVLTDSQGSARAVGPEAAARAMKICAEAGISIAAKNIWKDRESIASRLPAGELKDWLESFEAPKPLEEAVPADVPAEPDGESETASNIPPKPAEGDIVNVKFEDNAYTVHIGEIAGNDRGNITVELLGEGIGGVLPLRNGEVIIPVAMQILSGGKTVEYESCSVNSNSYLFRFPTSAMPEQIRVYGNDGTNSSTATFDAATKRLVEGAGNTELPYEDSAELQEGEENLRPDGNSALLHFYRPKSMVGAAISYNVKMDDEQLFRAKNNSRQTVRVTRVGLQTIRAKTESKSEIRIDIEPGREYYIRCDMKMGAFVGRPSIKLMDNITGKAEYDAVQLK